MCTSPARSSCSPVSLRRSSSSTNPGFSRLQSATSRASPAPRCRSGDQAAQRIRVSRGYSQQPVGHRARALHRRRLHRRPAPAHRAARGARRSSRRRLLLPPPPPVHRSLRVSQARSQVVPRRGRGARHRPAAFLVGGRPAHRRAARQGVRRQSDSGCGGRGQSRSRTGAGDGSEGRRGFDGGGRRNCARQRRSIN